MTRHPIGTFVEFVMPQPIASKKNGRKWIRRGRRKLLVPSDGATADATELALRARVAANGLQFHPDDALSLTYLHDLATDQVRIRVEKVGELPVKKRGTGRDVHGMLENIADALQGVLYPNDSAVDRFAGGRVR